MTETIMRKVSINDILYEKVATWYTPIKGDEYMRQKLALIGTGVVGERILREATQQPTYEIVGIFDENKERMNELAEKYDVHAMESLEALLDEQPDWVYIGTPPISHAPLTEAIAKRGFAILSEKPLAHDAADGEKMVAAVQQYGVNNAMHFPMMYSDEVAVLREAVREEKLGTILSVECHAHFPTWPRPWQQNEWIATRAQGGFIREIFPHYLQLTDHLFGDLQWTGHQTQYPEDPSRCETGTMAIGQTTSGIPVLFNASSGAAQIERIEYRVIGSEKVMTIRNWGELWISEKEAEEKIIHCGQLGNSFLKAIATGGLRVSFADGARIQCWIDELLQ